MADDLSAGQAVIGWLVFLCAVLAGLFAVRIRGFGEVRIRGFGESRRADTEEALRSDAVGLGGRLIEPPDSR
jgi:hypothetical protein